MTGSALKDHLRDFLDSLGVAPSADYDRVLGVLTAELDRIRVTVEFTSLRRGELTLTATPQAAALLSYDLERLAQTLSDALPGVVTTVRVRVRRQPTLGETPSTPDGTQV